MLDMIGDVHIGLWVFDGEAIECSSIGLGYGGKFDPWRRGFTRAYLFMI
jgi:hypothetical protein